MTGNDTTMKTIMICLFAVIAVTSSSGQKLNYEMTQDVEVAKEFKNEAEFNEYKCKDGSIIKTGDRLIIGKPSSGPNFSLLVYGVASLENVLATGMHYVKGIAQTDEVIIEKIVVGHTRMSRKSPLTVNVYCKNEKAMKTGNMRTVLDFEKALLLGEIINPNAGITREQAIAKLKESKDLLDLQVISQTEYDSIKGALMPVINN